MPEADTNAPLLTDRFERAFHLAMEVHVGQLRKGIRIPYLAHLMSVSALVLEHGGGEDAAIAGLLHDTVEDSDDGAAMEKRIRHDFGDRVADIVMGCSDAVAVPGKPKAEWPDRKKRYLDHLRHLTDPNVFLVSACDKLHNARSIDSDLRTLGEKVWSRFKAGKDDQLWYYGALVDLYKEKAASDSMGNKALRTVADELARVVANIRDSST